MVAMHCSSSSTPREGSGGCVPRCCRVLGHWWGQGFGGLDLDVHQEVPEVPEAGICVAEICLDALAGLWKVRGRSAKRATGVADNKKCVELDMGSVGRPIQVP
jgi:hypothetical protein